MTNKRLPKFVLILPMVLLVGLCLGQKQTSHQKPDFTGTWVLDRSQSNVDSGISDYVLTVIHREPDVRMTKQYKRGKKQITEEIEYHTDGKAEVNPSRRPDDPSPETKWRGTKLGRRSVSRRDPLPGLVQGRGSLVVELVTYEEWSLSSDQQTLTRAVEMTMGPSLIAKTKAVFKRRQ